MSPPPDDLSRRDFLKTAAACGAGSVLAAAGKLALGQSAPATGLAELATSQPATAPAVVVGQPVPHRPFGKTGVDVSILALGGIFDITANQLVLKQALKWGIDYWDTAASYTGGKSELGIGMYFEANPQERQKIFLVTKSQDGPGMEESLQRSLERMKTDYVDMFFVHGLSNASEFSSRARDWKAFVEKARAGKKIRYFGFSTHKNMARCLQAASALGFIDGIMFKHDYRVMDDDETKAAVEAAHKAGIGLTAMKTQAKPVRRGDGEPDLQLLDRFMQKGFTVWQAALKAVWEDPRISALCSAMYSLPVLQANYLAALDKTPLSSADWQALREYAQATRSGYCAGCSHICESAVAGGPPIADVMRYLMYRDEYGLADYARQLFADLPAAARAALLGGDYSAAERRCPQRIAIAALMKRASEVLA